MTPLTTFVDGTAPTAAELNVIPTNIDALAQITIGKPAIRKPAQPPSVWLYLNRNVDVPDDFEQVLEWHAADMVTDNGLWAPVLPGWVNIQTPGKYVIRAQVFFGARQGGRRFVAIGVNQTTPGSGVASVTALNVVANDCPMRIRTYPVRLVAGDVVRLRAYQNSGSASALMGGADPKAVGGGTWMSVQWVAPP